MHRHCPGPNPAVLARRLLRNANLKASQQAILGFGERKLEAIVSRPKNLSQD